MGLDLAGRTGNKSGGNRTLGLITHSVRGHPAAPQAEQGGVAAAREGDLQLLLCWGWWWGAWEARRAKKLAGWLEARTEPTPGGPILHQPLLAWLRDPNQLGEIKGSGLLFPHPPPALGPGKGDLWEGVRRIGPVTPHPGPGPEPRTFRWVTKPPPRGLQGPSARERDHGRV